MWILGLFVGALLVIYVFHCLNYLKFSTSSCSSLPPGSSGFPLIGETIQLMIPSYSLDLHSFIKNRIHRHGPIFRTKLFGKSVVISSDGEFNSYLVHQEGKSVEIYVGSYAKTLELINGPIYKCFRNITLNHVGAESIRQNLLTQLEIITRDTLHNWSTHTSIEVNHSSTHMVFHFFGKYYFGYDAEQLPETGRIYERLFTIFSEGFKNIPLNIPGTTFHKYIKEGKKAFRILRNIVEERRNSPKKCRGDFLDQVINDMALENDQIAIIILGTWFATGVSILSLLTLIFKFLSENPSVIEELRAEHEEILKGRDESNSSLTWNEYKSMRFTQQVINEALRFSVLVPGLLRIALKDIQVKEYTIPAGWIILAVTPALHMNSEIYEDPLTFNPWRWKDLDFHTVSKNFKPFGGGSRQCPGAELTRAFMATFLHVLVTEYRWTKIRGGGVVRNPFLGFQDGIHIKLWKKDT